MLRQAVVSFFAFFAILSSATQVLAGYDDGYDRGFSRYPLVVSQPIDVLPPGYTTVGVGPETFYYADGFFYQKVQRDQKYVLVPPPIGAVVYRIPAGYQMMMIHGGAYYIANGVSYRRTLLGYQVIRPLVV